jgi:CelD/BcsL family acetyltransferase involved in cellulose biosynthesis
MKATSMVTSIPTLKPDMPDPMARHRGHAEPQVALHRGDRHILATIRDEWRALCAEGPCDDPRLTPDWIEIHLATFEPGARVALFTVRVEGRLRGVLPLVEQRIGFGPIALRWYRSASDIHSTRFDIVHGASDEQSVIAALWQYLGQWKNWDVLHFRGIMDNGSLARIVKLAGQGNLPIGIRGTKHVWYIPIPSSFQELDAVIASRSKRFRKQLESDFVRLAERGEVRLRVLSNETDQADFQDGLKTFYAIEAAGWKGSAGTAIACDSRTLKFYNAIADLGLRQGFVQLHLLDFDGIPIAASYNILAGSQLIGLKTTYDEAFSAWSPGHLLAAHVLADSARRGLTLLDLGGTPAGDHAYKSVWTSESHLAYTGFVHQTSFAGRATYFLLFRLLPWVDDQKPRFEAIAKNLKQAVRRALQYRRASIGVASLLIIWVLILAVRQH